MSTAACFGSETLLNEEDDALEDPEDDEEEHPTAAKTNSIHAATAAISFMVFFI